MLPPASSGEGEGLQHRLRLEQRSLEKNPDRYISKDVLGEDRLGNQLTDPLAVFVAT